MITILGIDPGTNNCAYSIVNLWKTKALEYEVVKRGMIANPVKELNGFRVGPDMKQFRSEIVGLKSEYNVDFAIAERYMTRGHGGTTIEAVSSMLGLIASVFGEWCCFVPAAVWKNAWNKQYSLDDFYEEMSEYGIPTHEVDAVSIALYGATLSLDEPHFWCLKNMKQFRSQVIGAK